MVDGDALVSPGEDERLELEEVAPASDDDDEYFVVDHAGWSRVDVSPMFRRILGVVLLVCWLVGLYIVYALPDGRAKTMMDCLGANVNVTIDYGSGSDRHTVFGVYSGNRTWEDEAFPFLVVGIEPENACGPVNVTLPGDVEDAPDTLGALVARGGCPFTEKMKFIRESGIQLMLEYDKIHDGTCVLMQLDEEDEKGLWMGGVSITSRAAYDFIAPYLPGGSNGTSHVVVELSRGKRNHELIFGMLDLSEIALVVYAVLCISVGTWFALFLYDTQVGYHDRKHDERDDDVHVLSMRNAVSFIWVASGMLLVLFFLSSNILASFFALAFAVGGAESGYMVLSLMASAFVEKILVYIPSLYGTLYAFDIVSLTFSTGVASLWLLGRHMWFFYIGQDILAFFILISAFAFVRLSSLRVVTALLGMALVYDAFWVFIQPRLTGSSSIMVGVVEGLSLPLFVSFPQFSTIGSASQFNVLGLGDIALPGMCIVFAGHISKQRKTVSYFFSTLVAYVLGLFLCFVALAYNVGGQGGQPALVYIVPCILSAFMGCAWYRKEFRSLWTPPDDDHHAAMDEGTIESLLI